MFSPTGTSDDDNDNVYSDEEEYRYSDNEESSMNMSHETVDHISSSSSSMKNTIPSQVVSKMDYRIVSGESLQLEQSNLIHEIATVLELSNSIAGLLLLHFQYVKHNHACILFRHDKIHIQYSYSILIFIFYY